MSIKSPLIFIVDKNPIHRNLIKYYLDNNKFANVMAFPSGEECLYRLQRSSPPDFLISSFFTGNQSGFDFLHSVLEISPFVQVIFFDMFEDHRVAENLLIAGATDYVVKTRNPDAGIAELLKNLQYLSRKKVLSCV
jgi:DNA-binding NarL/FixJ family response regulator